eukprot:scaffold8641_cov134-Isochrysis_galbana.AAC.8
MDQCTTIRTHAQAHMVEPAAPASLPWRALYSSRARLELHAGAGARLPLPLTNGFARAYPPKVSNVVSSPSR